MGTRLPSAGEVLIIRPTGKKGPPPHRSNRVNPFRSRGHLPGSPGIPKQDPNVMRSSRNAVLREKNKIPV